MQAMQLCQDFAARLEWEISQPVPAYEEPSSEQKIQALDMNPEEILQSEAAETAAAVKDTRIFLIFFIIISPFKII